MGNEYIGMNPLCLLPEQDLIIHAAHSRSLALTFNNVVLPKSISLYLNPRQFGKSVPNLA